MACRSLLFSVCPSPTVLQPIAAAEAVSLCERFASMDLAPTYDPAPGNYHFSASEDLVPATDCFARSEPISGCLATLALDLKLLCSGPSSGSP
jgi:hypothetical protein